MKRLVLMILFAACSGSQFDSIDSSEGGSGGEDSSAGGHAAGGAKGGTNGTGTGGASTEAGAAGIGEAGTGMTSAGSGTTRGGSSGSAGNGDRGGKGGKGSGGTHAMGGDVAQGGEPGSSAAAGEGGVSGEPSTGGTGGSTGGSGGTGGSTGGTGGTGGSTGGTGGTGGSTGGIGGSAGTFSVAGFGGGPAVCLPDFSIGSEGYVSMPALSGCFQGYAFAGGDVGSSVLPTTFASCGASCQLHASGTVGISTEANAYAGSVYLGFNLNEPASGGTKGSVTPTGAGLKVTYTYTSTLTAYLELEASGGTRWCAHLPASGTGIAYGSFRKDCTFSSTGNTYPQSPIEQIYVVIPGNDQPRAFDLHITSVTEI